VELRELGEQLSAAVVEDVYIRSQDGKAFDVRCKKRGTDATDRSNQPVARSKGPQLPGGYRSNILAKALLSLAIFFSGLSLIVSLATPRQTSCFALASQISTTSVP
jgi:hypothetical protein